jgi:hypothetical protein
LKEECRKLRLKEKKKTRAYDLNRKFRDAWIAKLPWVKNVVYDDTLVSHVKCKICTKVMGKKQVLGPKFDSLCNNASKKKATSTMLSVPNCAFY